MPNWTATDARAALPEILDRVEQGEEAVITRHGRPVAVIVRPDRLRARSADAALGLADEVHARVERARHSPAPEHGLTRRRAEALVKELRSGRENG